MFSREWKRFLGTEQDMKREARQSTSILPSAILDLKGLHGGHVASFLLLCAYGNHVCCRSKCKVGGEIAGEYVHQFSVHLSSCHCGSHMHSPWLQWREIKNVTILTDIVMISQRKLVLLPGSISVPCYLKFVVRKKLLLKESSC